MRGDQFVAQFRDCRHRARRDHQLVRARAAIMPHRNRFASPDQFRAAAAEIAPPPARQLTRLAVARAVPALHRKDAKAIADVHGVDVQRASKRRRAGRRQLRVEPQVDARRGEMTGEGLGGLERREARIAGVAHARRAAVPATDAAESRYAVYAASAAWLCSRTTASSDW